MRSKTRTAKDVIDQFAGVAHDLRDNICKMLRKSEPLSDAELEALKGKITKWLAPDMQAALRQARVSRFLPVLSTAANYGRIEAFPVICSFEALRSREDLGEVLLDAVRSGRKEVFRALKKHGADVHYSYKGKAPILVASSPDMLQTVIDAGADVDTTGTFGDTAAHKAVRGREKTMLAVLIKADAGLNIRNNAGQTVAHLAARNDCSDNEEIIDMLGKVGVDWNVIDHDGRAPRDVAFSREIRIKIDGYRECSDDERELFTKAMASLAL